jgi:hypothetical protein
MPLPSSSDTKFAGSIPALYDAYVVPMLFEPYAADLVNRVRAGTAEAALARRFGAGAIEGRMRAHVVVATAPPT